MSKKYMNNLEKYKADLKRLQEDGHYLMLGLLNELKDDEPEEWAKVSKERKEKILKYTFTNNYNSWYNESLIVLKQLMPNRVDDFVKYYKDDKRKNLEWSNYTIKDFLIGTKLYKSAKMRWTRSDVLPKFQQQKLIVDSLSTRFESSLYDIHTLIQADLFDSELEEAKVLCKNGYYRAAGALCGVVLENHLGEVCKNHNVSITKKNPCISDYNEALKNASVIDISIWRHIQLLGDYRNKCDHKKTDDPTKDDIESLISGTEKIIKTVF